MAGKKISGQGSFERDRYLAERCRNQNVLHVGCTNHPTFQEVLRQDQLLHQKITEVANKVIGIDIVEEDINTMKKLGYNVSLVDAQKMSRYNFSISFDVVLLADVIEHIPNPGLVLSEAKKILAPGGKIIISVPNALGVVRFLKTFFRYEQVNLDHVAYYSSGTIETLAQNLDLKIEELAWYRFEVRDKRLPVYLAAGIERAFTIFFPWQAEGCIAVMTM